VFGGTVRENLSLLAGDATDDQLWAAIDAVGAADLVRRLGGLAGEISHGGGGLSSGERQLIALARVYTSRAQVVVLDEATAYLDPAAEAVAEQAFAGRGGTLIVIAHRLSSALRARKVLVMDGGSAVLDTHTALLRRSAGYAELMRAWSGQVAVGAP
jgi:ATP-binding cassette subfamily C protein